MFLHRIHFDTRCRDVRRDLSDPYQLHSTLCRAFSKPNNKCPEGEFLWRLEPETDAYGRPRLLVQSKGMPDWKGIGTLGWMTDSDVGVDIKERLKLDSLKVGQRFRFRLRANPCATRNGKRVGLLRLEEQETWLMRKGERHGFSLPQLASFDFLESSEDRVDVRVTQEQIMRGRQHSGNRISIFSVLYDGILIVSELEKFRQALERGIGHGKAMGLGLLSVVPVP